MIPAMQELTDKNIDVVGKRMRHELTGLEIKLIEPNHRGWRVQVLPGPTPDYVVNLTHQDLMRRFRDVMEE